MTDQRQPEDKHGDPLMRKVAWHWDEIEKYASPQQRDRMRLLLAGEAGADPAEARAELIDTLLDLLPPGHFLARALRAGTAYSPGPDPRVVNLPAPRGEDFRSPAAPVISQPRDTGLVPVTIFLADEDIHAKVETAVEAMLEAAGLRIESREEPVRGSWFRRMTARADERSPSGQDADRTAILAQNVTQLLTALQPTMDATVRVGPLVVVKVDGTVHVCQLTAAQERHLERHPGLAMSPEEIRAVLRPGQGGSASPDPGAERGPAVVFAPPRVVLVADDELPPQIQRRPDLLELWRTGVAVRFGLQEPPDGCRCLEAVVRMTVDTPAILGLWLTVPRGEDATGGPLSDAVLDTWGAGTQHLSWKLSARSELVGLRPRDRELLAVLESPQRAAQLSGTLTASIQFTSRTAARARTAEAGSLPFSLSLASGIAGIPPGGVSAR